MAQIDHYKMRTTQGYKINKPKTPIRCMQINLKHSRIATDNLMKLLEQEKTDVIFIQEPYLNKNKMSGITNSYSTYTPSKITGPPLQLPEINGRSTHHATIRP